MNAQPRGLGGPSKGLGVARTRRTLVVAGGVLVFSLLFQGSRGIWEPDEGRYTDIALEMLRSGDFVVPAFNHEVPHFAKPPLTYWAVAAGIGLAGRNEWGARLANALAFCATLLVVYRLGVRAAPTRPWLAPLVYATFLLPYHAANIITTDTLLTLWESLAVLAFARWWERRLASPRAPRLLMWLAFGLGFLTKGPPALLPLLAMVVFVQLAEGWRGLREFLCPSGVLVFAVVGLGWYAFVSLTNPGLFDYFVRQEVVARLASGAHHRHPEWYGAVLVYGPVLLFGTLPWTPLLLARLRSLPATLLAPAWWRVKLATEPWSVFVALWLLLPLAVFAVSKSRLPLYLLPLFVPLALVVARQRAHRPPSRAATAALAFWALSMVAVRAVAASVPTPRDARALAGAIRATAAPAATEVLFVNSAAVWGLALYLPDTELEEVVTGEAAGPSHRTVYAPQTLRAELAEGEHGHLLLVPPRWRSLVEAELAKSRRRWRQVGIVREWDALYVE